MSSPLLTLPDHLRERLIGALKSGQLAAPYSDISVRNAVGDQSAAVSTAAALRELESSGVNGAAVAFALELAGEAVTAIDRPDLVWSGKEVPGVHARDTRRVYEELVESAKASLWISAYTYFDGSKAFAGLAQRMDAVPGLQVVLMLNIKRKVGDTTTPDDLVRKYAERFWQMDWPGTRQPDVYYDPRSVEPWSPGSLGGVLHAKAMVADEKLAFITSANLTEAAFDRNIEVGVVTRDRMLATTLARHFRLLIDNEVLVALPQA